MYTVHVMWPTADLKVTQHTGLQPNGPWSRVLSTVKSTGPLHCRGG